MRIQNTRSLSSIFARFTLRLSTAICWRSATFSWRGRDGSIVRRTTSESGREDSMWFLGTRARLSL